MPDTAEPALFATHNPRAPAASSQRHHGQEPMPAWLIRRLEDQGHIDPDTGATRRAHMTSCRRCRRYVVIGFDGDPSRPHGGFQTRSVDPQPLTPLGEAHAILTERWTFELSWAYDHWEINGPRDAYRIEDVPATNKRQIDVVVEHDCAQSVTPLPHQPSQIPDHVENARLPDEPPF